MKTKLHPSFAILLIIIVIGLSCKKEDDKIDIRDPLTAECLLNQIIVNNQDTSTLFFDDQRRLIKMQKSDNDYTSITYDEEGKISQIDEYEGEVNLYYTKYTYNSDNVEAVYYQFIDSQWFGLHKSTIELNENNEIIKETKYSKDAVSDVWIEDGDYYIYEWEGGNLIKAENWDNYSSPATKKELDELENNYAEVFRSAKQVYLNNRQVKSASGDYKVYSTTLFEYDSQINSFRFLTVGNFLLSPDEFNISKNNWAKKTYSNINGRINTTIYTFEYNEKNYPVKLQSTTTMIIGSDTIDSSSEEVYKYECF